MPVEGACSFGGGFLRRACGRDAVGVCVYCAEPFCAGHGTLHPDYYEVCQRKGCVAKFADVGAHRVWLEAHLPSNGMSMCADDGCEERMQHACERCRLRFCDEHLVDRQVTERRLEGEVRLVQMMCHHCAARRTLWD